jgi:polar amino acid transport system substrate-binding protein
VFESTDSFDQAVGMLTKGEVDLLPAVLPTAGLRETVAVSKPYLSLPLVIATRKKEFFVGDPGNLSGNSVGILGRGTMPDVLSQKYPGIEFTTVDSTREGLERVVDEQDFAFIGTVPAIAYAIQEYGFYNIKISGRLEEKRAVSAAVAEEDRRLLAVVEKALRSIRVEERESVVDHWISVSVERRVDRTVLWQILIGVAVVAVVAAAWIRKVHSYNAELSAAYRMLEEKNAELETLSVTNQLTGLYNRNKLDTELAREVARSNRYASPLAVIMLDLDGFKEINDRFGHQSGDTVLRAVAERVRYVVRTADIPGRWGGEEFLVICPETDLTGAEELAERLRQEISATPSVAGGRVTGSFGVSRHLHGEGAEELIRRVDKNLYHAKREGKNRVVTD